MAQNGHVFELIPAYTLGCLEEGETQVVSAHLEGCARCQAELRSYREVAGQLALGAPQVDAPPGLKEALMERILPVARPERAFGRGPSWQQRVAGWLQRYSPALAAASLVLVLILGASSVALWQQLREVRSEQQLPFQVVALQGDAAAPQATGLIVISRDGRHGTLVVDDLPQLDEERQYQLWLIKDGERASGGVFSVGRNGYGSLWVSSPEPLAEYTGFGVTIEPRGGSPGPTGEKVLGAVDR